MQALQTYRPHPLLIDRRMEHVDHMSGITKGGTQPTSLSMQFVLNQEGQRPSSPESDHHPIPKLEVLS